jgi:hypothetical protein
MVATITADMKRRFIDEFKNDADSASVNYYIGISRSEDWNDADTAPAPTNTEKEQRDFRYGLQSVKKVANYSFVIPRVNWTSGTTYAGYNDTVVAHPTVPYYAMTENNAVYVCTRQGTNSAGVAQPSTVQPSGSSTKGIVLSDGYGWKFLYTIGTLDASYYKSANYIPVKLQGATDGSSPATDVEQLAIQTAAVSGRQIIGFSLDSGGAGYGSAPTVVITGDGDLTTNSGAHATAVISGGAVSKIVLNDDSAGAANLIEMGQGFNFASIALTGGGSPTTVATGKVIFGPKAGLGADPRDDLRARAIMFNAKPVGTEEGEFVVGNSFRQIGLIRNPLQTDSAATGVSFTLSDGNCLRRLQMASTTTAFTQRSVITGGTSGALAFVDSSDVIGGGEIWYHQNESTGFTQFQEGEAISGSAGGAGTTQAGGTDGDTLAYHESKVNKFSGDLLYIENRAAVTRAADQTEDIKVIIEI